MCTHRIWYLKGVVPNFGHRTSFQSEPMCYLSLETVFNTFHSVLIVAEIAGARLGQVDEQTNYNAAYTTVVNWLLHQSKVKFHR